MLNLFEIFFAWKYSVSKEGRAEIEAERARIFQEEDEAICNAIANGSADTLPLGLYKTSRGRIVRKLPHSQ